ncbi:MAG: amidohydrolase [Sphaerochaetaceae bacterium]
MININEEVKAEFKTTVEYRRHLHQNPELSFKEFKTADFIERTLKSFEPGLKLSRPTPTSVMAILKTDISGPIIAIRADIDALPIEEDNNLSYKSKNPGVMHACGHDGHTAMLLSTIKILLKHKEELKGEIRFIFQHAEELPPGGGIEIVKSGVLEGVDETYSMHLTSNFATGKLGICSGILTASTDGFEITIKGKGGHSSMPQQCIDPIPIAAQIILNIQTIVSRNTDPSKMLVISVCSIDSGTAYNIIPNNVTLTGSVRTFSKDSRTLAERRLKEISEGICMANGAQIEFKYNRGYDSVENNPKLTDFVEKLVINNFPGAKPFRMEPITPGEDFCYYSEKYPSFFMEIGARNEEKGIVFPHHNPKYLMDENALAVGVEYLVLLISSRCNKKQLKSFKK